MSEDQRISYGEALREAVRSMTGEANGIAVYGEQPPALLLDSIVALRELARLIEEAEGEFKAAIEQLLDGRIVIATAALLALWRGAQELQSRTEQQRDHWRREASDHQETAALLRRELLGGVTVLPPKVAE